MDLTKLTLTEAIKGLGEKQFSLQELNKSYLERIKKYNPELNAFLDVNEESEGIPVAIKSLISTKGMRTSAASKIIENYKPPFNATVIDHLIASGVSVIGKTNQDEFAMGSSGENSAFGPTKNPWNTNKVPGGSSSGSAVAVAADLAVFSLGTDTGGVNKTTGIIFRSSRLKAKLWKSFQIWGNCYGLLARPDRAFYKIS
jgi:aspartyl-tRNA(Asn)/glutamyl-tRNA(Gln) amidotransferase subunit A